MAQATDKVDDNKSQKEQPRLDGELMAKYVEPGSFEQTLKDPGDPALPSEKMNGEDKVEKVVPKTLTDPANPNQSEAEQRCTRITEQNSDIAKMRNDHEDNVGEELTKKDPGVGEVEQLRSRITEKDSEIAKLTMKVHEEKREKKLLTDQMKHMKEAFGELQKVNLGLEGDRKSNEEKLLSMNSEHKKLEDQNKKYAKDLEKMEKDRERDRKKLAEYNQQSNDLRSQVEACEEEKFHRESFINRMREELKDREIRLSLLRASKSSLTSTMAEEIEMFKRQNLTLAESINALTIQISALENQNRALREQLSAEETEREILQQLVAGHMDEAERAHAVIGVVRTMAEGALNRARFDPTLPGVEDVHDIL